MLTRGNVTHQYGAAFPGYPAPVASKGWLRVEKVNNIEQTWPIVRPNTTTELNAGTPFYLGFPHRANTLAYGGAMSIKPARPRLEMDPSDTSTWQRPYRFSY
jgi:hypothetical protein